MECCVDVSKMCGCCGALLVEMKKEADWLLTASHMVGSFLSDCLYFFLLAV